MFHPNLLVHDLISQYATVPDALGMAYVGLDHCEAHDRTAWQRAVDDLEQLKRETYPM